MKLRTLVAALILLLSGVPAALAQSSMTDAQVMDFAIKENEKGTSRSEITKKLIEKGVPLDQLRRVRSKYEKEQNGQVLGAKNISGTAESSRLRTGNGEERENPAFRNRSSQQRDSRKLTDNQRRRMEEQRDYDYGEELYGLGMRDSTDYLDDYYYDRYREEEDPTRQVFGRNIFKNKNLTFESDMNLATPSDYRLGAGDVVFVDVWGSTAQSFQCTVSPDGDISLDGYGLVSVGGLSVAQAQQRLKSTLGSRYQGSQIKLSLGQTKTISVNVFGEVENPGTYTLSAFANVFNALYMAGGTNDIGTLRNINVIRGGSVVAHVDIYDFILNGSSAGNVRLQSNDVIYVGPYDCLVQVQGKVKRPMFYEMKSNESVATLIKYAGGFTGDALEDNVRLVRKKGGALSVYTLDEFERGTFQLADADSLYVDSTLQRYTNMVEIKGAVRRPGQYQMDGGVTTVRSLVERAGGLLEEAFPVHAVMHRRKENRQLQVLSLDVKGILEHEVADVVLCNEDVLFIPTLQDYNDELTLSIEGEVLYPGTYDYAEGTTVEDLILQAGGLTDAASTAKVDVSRRLRDSKATGSTKETAQTFTFSLREGFIVGGEPGFVLQPYDEVFVRRSPGYAEQGHVKVSGEIAFAGGYALTKKNMRLSEVVEMAGGITESGYAHGARLIRALTPEEKEQQEVIVKAFMNNSMAVSSDSNAIKNKLDISDTKSVGIELDKALEHPGDDRWDIVLQDGDELFIPGQLNTVSITGEVMYPNTVAYNKDMRAADYIDQAGGYSLKSKKSRAFAINPNGTVKRLSHYSRIEPGATIIIPAKKMTEKMNSSQILSMTMSMASMGAVIVSALK
ncbi:MAG: SLBB domain-containing protein [Bacteroidaceae bacterium]|nr:SLBB domain-containing protein [Bacteroidaceae bacterium]